MKKKKILFIGDLREVENYGAIATTEALLELFNDELVDYELKVIKARSMYQPTPVDGFKRKSPHSNNIKYNFKRIARDLLPNKVKSCIRELRRGNVVDFDKHDFVPYKFSQFERYFQFMQKGEFFQYEKKLLEWADYVYINSEGNIVNGTDEYGRYRIGARYILFLAWVSKIKYSKHIVIANHTVDPRNPNAFEMISNIYPYLDKVLVREPLSIELLNKHGVFNAQFVPDALFSYKADSNWIPSDKLKNIVDFSKPYICIGDSSAFQKKYAPVKWNVVQVFNIIISELKKICPQIIFIDGFNGEDEDVCKILEKTRINSVNLNTCNYHDLYHILQGGLIFISGRWHASILSALANTPVLLWGSDSHKTKALYPLLDYKYRFFELQSLPANIPELISEAKKIITESADIKKLLASKILDYSELSKRNATVLNELNDIG